jgi:LysR family transcriptional regulator, regulator of abg operon
MRLNQIRDLLAVVEAGSLRAAARRIGVSQPSISKSIAQLEREVQAQLLLRTAQGVMLTAAGRAFVARGRVIHGELRKVHDDLAALRGIAEGAVSFGSGPAVTFPLVPDAMSRFRSKWPRAHVRIREGMRNALLPLVRDETLDFSISENVAPGDEAGLEFKPLIQPELAIVARRGHPLANAVSLQDLAKANWLVFNLPGAGGALERTFKAYGLSPPNALVHCESYATALALVARSDLLALVLRHMLEAPMSEPFLQRIRIQEKVSRPTIGIFSRAGAPLSPTAAAMVQAFSAAARAFSRVETSSESRRHGKGIPRR